MKKRRIFPPRAALSVLCIALAMAILLNFFQADRVQALESQISAAYQKAFFETQTLMDGIGTSLEKMLVSGSGAKEQELLGDISRQADAAQDNLSMLPASLPAFAGALKFVNQLSDYTRTLNERLASGGAVGEEDHELLLTLHAGCQDLNRLLAEMSAGLQQGENPFDEPAAWQSVSLPADSASEPMVEYPSLLYDGPFSDGRNTGRLAALGDQEYTSEQAVDLARRFIGEDRILSIRLTGEGSTPVPCYEITAYVREGELSLAVTRQGGQIIYMLCSEEPEETRFSQGELIDMAASFLKTRGYPQTAVSYWSFDNHLLTINFAAMQDGVILYPDLIKVQMDASTGLIVGLEALNYLTNHVARTSLTPTLTEREAHARLGALSADEGRLCVIPTETAEALAWEFSGTAYGNRYLVYIDAHTGEELDIYRIIEDEDGQQAV